jgi:acyl carrier protein
MQERLTDEQFVGYVGERSSADTIEIISQLRYAIADFTTVDIEPVSVLPNHKIESDLGIHHLDSLDIVDLATSLESAEFKFQDEDLLKLAELNEADATVGELAITVLTLVRASRAHKRTEQDGDRKPDHVSS